MGWGLYYYEIFIQYKLFAENTLDKSHLNAKSSLNMHGTTT